MCFLGKFGNKADEFLRKKLVSSLDLFPPLNSFPPFRSKEKLVSAETIQGTTVYEIQGGSIDKSKHRYLIFFSLHN